MAERTNMAFVARVCLVAALEDFCSAMTRRLFPAPSDFSNSTFTSTPQ